MDEIGIVAAVLKSLNELAIPYMLVGSLSSNAYGIERNTKDADLVVQLGAAPLAKLVGRLPEGFRMDPQIGFETITSTTRFRLRYESLAYMVELFEVSEDPHDVERFRHRVETRWAGEKAYLPRAEDVVVTKLRWAASGKSRAKDADDVRNVLLVQKGNLDLQYIRHWCDQHGTRERFEQLLSEAG